jgi:hypothetical protein
MLKLTIKRETASLGKAGDMHTVVVTAGGVSRLLSLVEPDGRLSDEPPDSWRLYVLDGNCDAIAASLLHGLELGIASAARWIAVELLKDQTPPADEEKVEGVALWLNLWDYHGKQLRASYAPLGVYSTTGVAPSYRTWWFDQQLGYFAAEEQALAALIEHAAPWIAAALVKEATP